MKSRELSSFLGIEHFSEDDNSHRSRDRIEAIRIAVDALSDKARAGKIELQGKYFSDILSIDRATLTETIRAVRFADFRCFDPLDDALIRGRGVAWNGDFREISQPDDDRHFRWVEVRRSDLIEHFPKPRMASVTSTVGAEEACRAWLQEQFECDPDRRRVKGSFLEEAIELFQGRLSRRGFDRAWRMVAPAEDRDKGGAKRKR